MSENPQKENGYTAIANELMEELARTRIPGAEYQILNVVLRKTYGWNKKVDKISFSQFSELTGLKRPHVIRSAKSLVSKMILGSTKNGTNEPNSYWFIKQYKNWRVVPKKVLGTNNDTRGGTKNGTKGGTKNGTYKNNIKQYKTNTTKVVYPFFDLWNQYPKEKRYHTKIAQKNFDSTVKSENDWKEIQNAFENYMKSDNVKKGYIFTGSAWFSNWQDWINQGKGKESGGLTNELRAKLLRGEKI